MKNRLIFVKIDEKYIEYLSRYENKIAQKKNRIWIGVLLEINNIKYFAPLSSPKEKHMKMNEQIDFMKIDSGKLGVINFNNMIPIRGESNYIKVVFKNEDEKYKYLLQNQYNWIKNNKTVIFQKAEVLYTMIEKLILKKKRTKFQNTLLKRCVNFKKLEKIIEIEDKKIFTKTDKFY